VLKSVIGDRNLPLEIIPFDAAAGLCYGRIRTELKRVGLLIGNNDLLIASHALSLNVAIATNNLREFSRVPFRFNNGHNSLEFEV